MRGQTVVRRVIVFFVLFSLVTVAAIGLSGLLARLLDVGTVVVDVGGGDIARSLAFTLIATPLAVALWWWEARRLRTDPEERSSIGWGLYLLVVTLTSLVVATVGMGDAAAAALAGQWRPGAFATGVVWAAVWVLHRALHRSPSVSPMRLGIPIVSLSAVWGLAVGASGAIAAIAALVSDALDGASVLVATNGTAVAVLQGLVWAFLGAAAWAWHTYGEGARTAGGGFAEIVLVAVTAGFAALALVGAGVLLQSILRLLFGDGDARGVLTSVDVALAAALVAGIISTYYGGIAHRASSRVRQATRLAVAGIAVIGAASGFGVVVNALLASLTAPIVATAPLTLLLGGLSALVIGAPVWWLAWRPAHPSPPAVAPPADAPVDDRARRVYLVIVFGTSAIVAIIALLMIGSRLLALVFDASSAGGAIDALRAPLGVLVATGMVFAYHFAVWRRTRGTAADTAKATIGRILLVAGGPEGESLAAGIRTGLGVPVTLWRTADAAPSEHPAAFSHDALSELVQSLRGIVAPRVLVIADAAGPRIIPLAE
ncbi:DUF5671 domain-containing protein [Microbacterium sp. NPDC055357]